MGGSLLFDFPQVRPSRRSFTTGTYPVKTFQAQNGAEVRIKYGNRLTGKRLNLTYTNVKDSVAQAFIDHYISVEGTFQQFDLGAIDDDGPRAGWKGDRGGIGAAGQGMKYRYSEEPQIESVYIDRSTVTIKLIATPIP